MKKLFIASSALAIALAAPASAADFGIFGTYAQAEDADSSVGGGIKTNFGLAGGLGVGLRATYLPDLGDDLGEIFDDESDFGDFEMSAVPLDLGLTYGFGPNQNVWVGGGATYVILDPEFGEADDQAGWFAEAGVRTDRASGINFFAEAVYRGIESTVNFDPEDFDDIDDIEFRDEVDLDLSGFSVNAGVALAW